jgi:ATP-dependent helicase/DNAse subunit B
MPPAARLRLLTGPAGSGKTHAALERIRDAATAPGTRGRRAARPDDALLVLPTYAQVNHVKRRALSRWDVRGLFDRPFATFTAVGERYLEGFRVRALPSREERDRLMEEALRQRDVPLFREVADRPGFRAHLLRLVKEIKQTGLEGGEARERLAAAREEVGRASRPRLDGFLLVFETYEDLLERAGLEDHEDALRRLARLLAREPPAAPPALLVVDGFDDFSRVEERILHALVDAVAGVSGEVLVTLPWDEARPALFAGSRTARERLLARGFVEEALQGFARSDAAPLARLARDLFAPSGAPSGAPCEGGDAVQVLVAGDAEDEAEAVARAVRALVQDEAPEGVRGWRDVGLVVRRWDVHAPRLEGAFARLGIPLRVLGPGDVLAREPVVRALRGPLEVLGGAVEAGRFEPAGLLEWLRWRALLGGDAPPVHAVDRWDMRLREDGFPADLDAFLARAPAALAACLGVLEAEARRLGALRGAAALYDGLALAIVALAPLPEPSGFDPEGRPRDPAHDLRLARTVTARARLLAILAALREAARRTGLGGAADVAVAVGELLDAAEQTAVSRADRRLDAVTLMDAEEARFWDLPVIVVAGLEEGGFPVRPREDVLLRDRDREALRERDDALGLPLARDREVRERRLFYGAVTRAGRRLLLSRRAYDDRGDPKAPSSFLEELEAVVTPRVALAARTPGRVARAPGACFTRQDWRLFSAGRLGPWAREGGDGERELAAALRRVSGTPVPARAARHRRAVSDPLAATEDERAAVRARFVAATQEVSVSRLNQGVACPYRFFLAYVAEVPQDELTLEGPVFDVRAKGRALHHAFELALRHPERDAADVAAAGVEHVDARGLEARLLAAELERAVELLRDRERRAAGALVPWTDGLEYAFRGEDAVEIGPADCRYRLGGFVDRIDRTEPGPDGRRLATILDYKRTATSAASAFRRCEDGRDLQLPLYARALEAREGLHVVGLEWAAGLTRSRRVVYDAACAGLFAARREENALVEEPSEAFRARLERAEAVATEVVRRARAGVHERAPAEGDTCAACDWNAVCRPDRRALEARRAAADGEEGA